MMEIELPKMHQSQQDMDLIDILWRQDIDLGAGREVFDYSHRQKEHELQRQRELEEEKRQQLLREQEKAVLAQLQLDEETGEFVPRPAAGVQPQTSTPPPEVTQDGLFTEEDGNALSFDECMQLLAETFPLVEAIETTPPPLDPAASPPAGGGPAMMAPQQPPLPAAEKSPQELEQAWMELLSIPELQQCLNMQMADVLEPSFGATTAPTELQDPNYFYMPTFTDMVAPPADAVGPTGYLGTFEGTISNSIPPDNLNQMSLKASEINPSFSADGFCDMFYPGDMNTKVDGPAPPASNGNTDIPLAELQNTPPLKPIDIPDPTTRRESQTPKDGISGRRWPRQAPFTKDKHKKRSESRLSRDEQRAKALRIPFTVEMIINLPVDDFNEMMSKQQLNEAQLALVRDIRRRGKNKVAAQNCRKRKMENIVGLEYELDSLKEERERLLREHTETGTSLRQMKQQLSTLYLEVFSLLRDEEGKPYSPSEYSLQQTSDGSVFLVPRVKKTLIKNDSN
ncbi:hypothetical protein AGOR_G00069330 [Albula goreensis]|uniref:BZIP domain-containing protein n=1 Tax=Albula goreensis TaxID=1534307 RepID=A0A8T3DQM6_9TELE|nr:hypothetical protein AGOR_G00069330 [Albula goreensis]